MQCVNKYKQAIHSNLDNCNSVMGKQANILSRSIIYNVMFYITVSSLLFLWYIIWTFCWFGQPVMCEIVFLF